MVLTTFDNIPTVQQINKRYITTKGYNLKYYFKTPT